MAERFSEASGSPNYYDLNYYDRWCNPLKFAQNLVQALQD